MNVYGDPSLDKVVKNRVDAWREAGGRGIIVLGEGAQGNEMDSVDFIVAAVCHVSEPWACALLLSLSFTVVGTLQR